MTVSPGEYDCLFSPSSPWYSKFACHYPEHTGKAKADRSIGKIHSKQILEKFGALVPVGLGINFKHR